MRISDSGWLRLQRSTFHTSFWQTATPEQKVIYITLNGMANWKPNEWIWKGKKYICQPGEMITSLDAIAQECGKGITRAKVRTAINKLKKHGILTRESTKESTLIRLTNWQTEQGFFDSDNQCETRDELGNYPTDNQPLTSIEEYKNRIRKKNREYGTELASDWLPSPSLINELSSLRTDLDLKKVFNSFVLFHKAKGTRLKDWDSAFAKWVMDEKKNGPNKKISDMPEFTY